MQYDALKHHYVAQAEQAQRNYPDPASPQHRRAQALLALLPLTKTHREAAALYAWMVYGRMAATRELLTVETLSRRWQADNWTL